MVHSTLVRRSDRKSIRQLAARAYREGTYGASRAKRFLILYPAIVRKMAALFALAQEHGVSVFLQGSQIRTEKDVAAALVQFASESQVTFASKVQNLELSMDEQIQSFKEKARR